MLIIPFFMLVALLSSTAANAQPNEVYNNSAACDFKVELTITDGTTTTLGYSNTLTAGSTLSYTPPTGYTVSQIEVIEPNGSNTAVVSDLNPVDDVDHCTAGTIDVEWQNPVYTQINI